ncbi:TetR/AcrR family transcriptional regulator [Microbacterium sp. No. 7]|uniref:TetR/AcrR family transcriptional regulator n=1 Tax=Microbacterium sp. No. 7 TaxID=1714373 RepID=UPI000AB48081|nr:TetR/AcrR family transcriptional regulator [Microbacterium sp. No. 7]
MTTDAGTAVPHRADARRNRERLLAAAISVFSAEGANAPLDKIARTAGIGNATMYRHFPTREALLEAVLGDVYQELILLAEQLMTETPAVNAVERWLRAFIDFSQSYVQLPEPIVAALYDETSALYESCDALRIVAGRLIKRAQEDGSLRADINIVDVTAQASGIAWVTQFSPDKQQTTRLLGVLMDGLTTGTRA